LYPESSQSDYVREMSELDTFSDVFNVLLKACCDSRPSSLLVMEGIPLLTGMMRTSIQQRMWRYGLRR